MNMHRMGLRPNPPKLRTANKIPRYALEWAEKNKDRVKSWKNTPYFLTSNQKYFKDVLK